MTSNWWTLHCVCRLIGVIAQDVAKALPAEFKNVVYTLTGEEEDEEEDEADQQEKQEMEEEGDDGEKEKDGHPC